MTVGWNVAWTIAACAALAGMLAARRAAVGGPRRRWTWWAAAAACWLGGQIAWDVYAVIGLPPSPNLADVGWWAFAILVIAGLASTRASGAVQAVAVVEALPLIAATLALTVAELWDDAAASSLSPVARVSVLVYPALFVSAAVLTLQAVLGGSLRDERGAGLRLVLAGMVVHAVAFILWSPQLLQDQYVVGASATDPLWAFGLLATGLGGVMAARAPARAAAPPDTPGALGGLLPAAMFLLLMAALFRAELGDPPLPARLALAVGLLISGATLIARASLLQRRLRGLLAVERVARETLAAREADLATLNERLLADSRRDALTGLGNRRALAEDLRELERHGSPVAVALCDVDGFKAYNDRFGHLAGDEALRVIAATVRGALRRGDAAYRYGGEELLLVLRGAGLEQGAAVAERVRAAVGAAALPQPGGALGHVTVSIGVAAGAGDAAAILPAADAALYRAKAGGRDLVVAAGEEGPVRVPPGGPAAGAEDPLLRPLRSLLAVSRAAAAGHGAIPVLEALAATLRTTLRYGTVVVSLRDPDTDELEAVVVQGEEEVRAALLGTRRSPSAWQQLLAPAADRLGPVWLPGAAAGPGDPPVAALAAGAWDAADALLLPLRSGAGDLLGAISVEAPRTGLRPSESERRVLVAVADYAAALLEQAAPAGGGSARLGAVMLLAQTLDLRDAGTAQHSRTVGRYARDAAAALGLRGGRLDRVHAAGVLHDLGKLGIPDAILQKPGPLDGEEWREVRRHPEIGARILEHAGLLDIANWVRAHHERIDGAGYPAGLPGREVPLEARILAVADAYEAMVADRPYRRAMPAGAARAELLRAAGTQFDERVVAAFLRGLDGTAQPAAAGSSCGVGNAPPSMSSTR